MNIFFLVIPYEITVITGDKLGAGTDANVFLTIYGENEDSGKKKERFWLTIDQFL